MLSFPSKPKLVIKLIKKFNPELHEPIADNDGSLVQSDGIIREPCVVDSHTRDTLNITSLGGYSNHPKYDKPEIKNLDDLYFRVEHERTMTVIKDETTVFLIHVDVYPFKEV